MRSYARSAGVSEGIRDDAAWIQQIALRRLGAVLEASVKQGGHNKAKSPVTTLLTTLPEGISRDLSSKSQRLALVPEGKAKALYTEKRGTGTLSINSFLRLLDEKKSKAPPPPKGKHHTLVVDPPWKVTKIAREDRSNQAEFGYSMMDEDEIRQWGTDILVPAAADDSHLYLWTTHKYLPLAIELAGDWGFKYKCLLTWVKNVGMTPFSWMYSTEHVVFAKRGSLDLKVNGKRLDFSAKVRGHSVKPDEFYDLVCKVSPGPRIDFFARGKHDGFESWGDEAE